MEKITIEEIKEYCNGDYICFNNNEIITKICIDSREADKNSLFIPIIGETHDGHEFMDDAYNNGCRNFLIDKNHKYTNIGINLIKVENTNIAFGNIAKEYRNCFNIPFIGITGSVGKTSTKDMIYAVLTQKYNTLKNIGNLNNKIGLPRTILNIKNETEVAVLELGMSAKGEIDYLTNILNPNIAVISNIGLSHIENFNNQEEIFNTKMEITNNFNSNNILIVNGDDKFLSTLKDKKLNYRLLTYGMNNDNDIYCTSFNINKDNISFSCFINNQEETFVIPTTAEHNIYNAMAAILIGLQLNMNLNDIKEGLKTFELTKGRLTLINKKDITIIDDSYNASQDSIISALKVLKQYRNRRVAVLGDVLETGNYERQIHETIGENVINNVDYLITVGTSSKIIDVKVNELGFNNNIHFNNYKELIDNIDSLIKKDDVILIKASHGIQLNKVVEYLEDKYE